jgi:hypothetical protein
LADQQKWSPAFTARAVEEYRKFIFLCCIAPNGASPSKIVDEVWHLHLTYTQSYWNAFCKNTLGKDIHHYPSAGGEQEDHKHSTWYADTLQLYETVFGTPAPADIWPAPGRQPLPVFAPFSVLPSNGAGWDSGSSNDWVNTSSCGSGSSCGGGGGCGGCSGGGD